MSKFDEFNEKVLPIFDKLVEDGFIDFVAIREVPGYINHFFLVRGNWPVLPNEQRLKLDDDYYDCAHSCGITDAELEDEIMNTGYLVVSRNFYNEEAKIDGLIIRECKKES